MRTIAFVVDIQELALDRVGERAGVIDEIAVVAPHAIVAYGVDEPAFAECHVAVGEEFAVESAVLECEDPALLLPAVVIVVSESKRRVLDRRAIGHLADGTAADAIERHTIDSPLNGNVARNGRHRIRPGGGYLDDIACGGIRHSRGEIGRCRHLRCCPPRRARAREREQQGGELRRQ